MASRQERLKEILAEAVARSDPAARAAYLGEACAGDYCDQKNLSRTERLQLCMQVCHAVQHAHQKGIIHRDLKPSKRRTKP